MSNPYDDLGLSKTATTEEIKKAYRRLAKKNHPDLNPGNKAAEAKFKKISHANDLIGTPEARAKFEEGEANGRLRGEEREQYSERPNGARGFFHRTQRDGGRYASSFGDDFLDGLFRNQGGRPEASSRGADVMYQMDISFNEAALGGDKILTLQSGKKIQVTIPPGVEQGKRLRFKGLGETGRAPDTSGDALVEISVSPAAGFIRIGQDIQYELSISFVEAILGAEIRVPTIDGDVLVKIPPGVSTGSKLRVKGKGVGAAGSRGNQLVLLKVATPKDVSPTLRKAIEDLRAHYQFNPRENI